MKVIRRHNLTRGQAKEKVEELLPSLELKYGQFISDLTSCWKEDVMEFSFNAQGFNITGNAQVDDVEATVFVDIPFLLKLLEGKILSTIEQTLDNIFPEVQD